MHIFADAKNYVCECSRTFNSETLHPQVCLIDTSRPCADRELCTDCYAVSLQCDCSCKPMYGRLPCDFTDAVMLFSRPGDELALHTAHGRMLIFHPDMARCTPLAPLLRDCTFFNYNQDEALHLSCAELRMVNLCLDSVSRELQRGVDDYSQSILCSAIGLLLNQCRRLYHRQFITRHEDSAAIIAALTARLDDYFMGKTNKQPCPQPPPNLKSSPTPTLKGSPSPTLPRGEGVKFASWVMSSPVHHREEETSIPTRVALSPLPTGEGWGGAALHSAAYLNDMLQKETGHTTADYVQCRRIHAAKLMLMDADRSIASIAKALGFCSANCFATMFKKLTGCTPQEYRKG